MSKKIEKVADKIVNSYMALKIPVGYSFIHNAKQILQQQFGCEIDDDQLQEVFARFLDAIIFGLIKDTQNVGGAMPTAENFYAIALEVLQNSYDENEDDEDEDEDLSRYDMPLFDDDEDDQSQGAEQAVPGRF